MMAYLRSIQVDRRSRPTVSLVKLFPSALRCGTKVSRSVRLTDSITPQSLPSSRRSSGVSLQ